MKSVKKLFSSKRKASRKLAEEPAESSEVENEQYGLFRLDETDAPSELE